MLNAVKTLSHLEFLCFTTYQISQQTRKKSARFFLIGSWVGSDLISCILCIFSIFIFYRWWINLHCNTVHNVVNFIQVSHERQKPSKKILSLISLRMLILAKNPKTGNSQISEKFLLRVLRIFRIVKLSFAEFFL